MEWNELNLCRIALSLMPITFCKDSTHSTSVLLPFYCGVGVE